MSSLAYETVHFGLFTSDSHVYRPGRSTPPRCATGGSPAPVSERGGVTSAAKGLRPIALEAKGVPLGLRRQAHRESLNQWYRAMKAKCGDRKR
ncbi:Hypothetical protein SMAX5B_002092 [Scophthalmus maximus]|uniref:Uncharacterized protein n=1 Tax=Scophthalmus maximus TaxID=52904 RepID=A0A2U9CWX9_SCOMX|nr:Hypothetical protein SMAX5B_002092 [Scophthalmus maximus]